MRDASPVAELIAPRWIVPIEPAGTVLEDHAIAVDDGRVVAVLPLVEARARCTRTRR